MGRTSVVVVGAGIAGLAAAWELTGARQGPDDQTPRVEIIEASARVGGALATTTFQGRVVDLGADGVLARRPEALALLDELGLSDQVEYVAASGASLYARGALRPLPAGLVLGVPTDASALARFGGVSWRARLAARRDRVLPRRFEPRGDVTIGDVTRAKLGRELTYQLIEPMIGGIQAGRVDDLSAASVFPALLDAARQGGSLARRLALGAPAGPGPGTASVASVEGPAFASPRDGVGSLVVELARQLEGRGVVVRRGVAVTALRRTPAGAYPWEVDTLNTTTPANAVVLATPAPVVAALLGAHDASLADLAAIDSAGAAILTFSYARDEIELPVDGTGVLVPLGTAWSGDGTLLTTALTFLDRKWPRLRRDDDVLLRAHVGRSDDARWQDLNDDELARRVQRELAFLLARAGTPRDVLVQRWPQALPQYRPGHASRVRAARDAAAALRVTLAGSAYDGVGVPASIGSGRQAARDVLLVTGSGD